MVCLVVHGNTCKELRNLWWQDKNCSIKINWCLIEDAWSGILADGLPVSVGMSGVHVGQRLPVSCWWFSSSGQKAALPLGERAPGKRNHCWTTPVPGVFSTLYFRYISIKEAGFFLFSKHTLAWSHVAACALEKGPLWAGFAFVRSPLTPSEDDFFWEVRISGEAKQKALNVTRFPHERKETAL